MSKQRPRELRRRVLLRARVRSGAGWSDASILNLSSRGMMINAHAAALQTTKIELWHGDRMIIATVVWTRGTKAGLRSHDRVPVDELMASSQAVVREPAQPARWTGMERRRKARSADQSRHRARLIQFAGVALIGCVLVANLFLLMENAFGAPLKIISSVLEAPAGDDAIPRRSQF